MQRTKGSNSWTVFTVVAVIALGSTIASAGLGPATDSRLVKARAAVGVECIDIGTVSLCASGDAPRHAERLAQATPRRAKPYLMKE